MTVLVKYVGRLDGKISLLPCSVRFDESVVMNVCVKGIDVKKVVGRTSVTVSVVGVV